MNLKELEVFCDDSNFAVVRMPGRNHPGVVIQGDSLAILARRAGELVTALQVRGDRPEIELARELLEHLMDRLRHYEQVLSQHGLNLPYAKLPS